MAKRVEADKSKYIKPETIEPGAAAPNMIGVAYKLPLIVNKLGTSVVKRAEIKPDWSLYKFEVRNNNPFIVREMCDRCGKVWISPRWRKIQRVVDEELGPIYVETGVCKDCINASMYVDKYLDGAVLGEVEAKKVFYQYGMEYEKAWRMVIAAAPRIAMTEQEWQHRCNFFQGCAICGGPIQTQVKFFPKRLNGEHTAWNVIPLCEACQKKHYAGRLDVTNKIARFKVFSTHELFQKTKTIRLYLLHQMETHNVYMDPLIPWRKRFFETKILSGSE